MDTWEDGTMEEGFAFFLVLMRLVIRPSDFTFTGVLNACADHVADDLGEQVHGYKTRIGINPLSFVASALVHMYSKCETIRNAKCSKFSTRFSFMDFPDCCKMIKMVNQMRLLSSLFFSIQEPSMATLL